MTHPSLPPLAPVKTTPPSQFAAAFVVIAAALSAVFWGWLAYQGMTWLIYWGAVQ